MNRHRIRQPLPANESSYYHNDSYGSQILVGLLRSQLGLSVLEVGAGAGFVTRELAKVAARVTAIEPNLDLFAELTDRTADLPNVVAHNLTLEEFVERQSESATSDGVMFDSVVYINVLEHIKDDSGELLRAQGLLSVSGSVLIVVPAHQWLYARVDHLSGHHRRYSRRLLRELVFEAGLEVDQIRYFDTVGLIPYFVIYKLLRSTAVNGANATIYSRLVLPVSVWFYRCSRGRLIGKNLIAVARVVN